MSAQVADFNIRFNTENAQFNRDIEYAKKMLRGYAQEAEAANDSTAGFTQKLDKASASFQSLRSTALKATGIISAGLGSLATATTMMISKTADQGREIERMAGVAQVSAEQIQALAYASEQYSISGDKMADILKDTNDKLGDFTANGGGEFKDFFDNVAPKVGLTANELSKLSSPEVLVAVKNAMDEANVPMKEQITYLEAIADEASGLMPLLENNGQKLYELTGRYDDLNVAMSEFDIQKFKDMDQKLNEVGMKLQRSFANAVIGSSDQIDWLTDKLTTAVDYWGTMFDSMADTPRTESGLVSRLSELRSQLKEDQAEREKLTQEFEKYRGVDRQSLPSINPFGQSKNELANINTDLSLVNESIEKGQQEIDRLQKKYNTLRFGMNYDTPQPGLRDDSGSSGSSGSGNSDEVAKQQKASENILASLDNQYASEREKLKLAHDDRLEEIAQLNVSEEELRRRGFDSMEALRAEYRSRENDFYEEKQEEFTERQEEAMQRELDAYAAKEEAKTEKATREAERRAKAEERYEKQALQMKMQIASQALGIIASTAEEGSALQKAAFVAQKALAAMSVIQQGEVAAMGAIAEMPTLAGEAMAVRIRAMAAVSAGLIMGQGLAGMAHSGISEIPAEGTWLLNKGERVYTNESANQIDSMYERIMSLHDTPSFRDVGGPSISGSMPSVSSSDSQPIHQHFTYTALGSREMRQMIMDHREDVYNAVAAVKRDRGENL
ncbi:hypothetical protein [Vibrio sp. ABG19]|uniref:hypothetical protein n=1 Tax=Vibrio sp. ABG19 TaxID=2817385 RepID=UPI00249F11E7|nr:hypothetical protein [Vibrio sp. ABG19]WGY45030.1 hypothetical protein J0X00_04815 [Vibrio sp. ABG19]